MNCLSRSISGFTLLTFSFITAVSCGKPSHRDAQENTPTTVSPKTLSNVNTVNIPNTSIKWQSIGNCWAYSALGWVESMMLRDPSVAQPNYSETYVTYRHYELQLTEGISAEIQTGGSFREAAYIITRFGLMNEGDFAPEEANLSKSERQKKATSYINTSLKTGLLSKSRDAKVVRAELDSAFGVQLDKIADKIIPASSVKISAGRSEFAQLDQVMNSWREARWPVRFSDYPSDDSTKPSARWSGKLSEDQIRLLRRVMRALNAKYPVVIDWFVDFNAVDKGGVFSLKTVQQTQIPGRQGYHSTVLEDYVATGVNPNTNTPFETPEGEASDEVKSIAAQFGSIKSFIIKNSWGGSERLDRPSYSVGGEKGFHKLSIDYLAAFLPEYNEKTSEFSGYTTGISGFVLPPGF